ncbi:TPA: hypothetical protein ACXM5I_001244 [Staphylococcus aureus]
MSLCTQQKLNHESPLFLLVYV